MQDHKKLRLYFIIAGEIALSRPASAMQIGQAICEAIKK